MCVSFGAGFRRDFLAVFFGAGQFLAGAFWRPTARGPRPPPRAPRARKNGFFLPFLAKIGVIFVTFCENLVRKLVKVNEIGGIFVMILVISEFVEKKIEIWKVLRASFGQSLHFLKFFFFSCQILTQFFQIFKHFELFANKNRKNRR